MTAGLRPGQGYPPVDLDVSAFPTKKLKSNKVVYRSHSADNGPGWFSSSKKGRFDLSAPNGTAYVADSIHVAIRERFGTQAANGLTDAEVRGFKVSRITGVTGRFANVSHSSVADNYPITTELTSLSETRYEISQAWAELFHSADFNGVRYTARFSPGKTNSWAIFGEAGAHDIGTDHEELSGAEACKEVGIRVLPPAPTSVAGLRLI